MVKSPGWFQVKAGEDISGTTSFYIDVSNFYKDNCAINPLPMTRYLDPKNDFIFKKIFGHHPDLLKSFLNAVLPLPEGCIIESLTYLISEHVPVLDGSKSSIVDVRCKDNHDHYFIVEMQMEWITDFIKRMLYNTATTYVRQLKKGEPYQKLSPVYGLALINDRFEEGEEWFHHYKMSHATDEKKILNDIQLVLIELPKLKPTTITEKKLTILWLRFLKEINEKTKEIDPHLLEVEEIKKALELLEVASYNETELLEYDKRWDLVSSEKTLLTGKFAEGLAKGEAKGLTKGRAEGEIKAKTEMVRNFHQLGIPIEQIAIAAKLSHQEVEDMILKT
ncbi:MAG: Rpn family recombination-promoting nuclease/putative transposase [Chthoniobacterales bacterium]|nr:Rpn family recombination-promoting nuclease/putative transposase [Chthoniobacterales bacterium]